MLTFENVGPGEPLKVLTSNYVEFKDGKEDKFPVTRMVITIEAGGISHMMVERYLAGSGVDPIVGVTAVSDDIEDGYAPTTFKNHYTIGAIEGDFKIKVAGPHAKCGQMNGRQFHRAMPEEPQPISEKDAYAQLKEFEAQEMARLRNEESLDTDK